MKKRTLTISLIVLAIMLLVGIGYAGWVISSTTSGEAGGNFQAYAVDSADLTVTSVDNSVTFGKPVSTSTSFVWLEAQGINDQDLVATFKVQWSQNVTTPISFTLTHSFYTTVSETTSAVSGEALTNLNKLIANPTFSVAEDDAYTLSGSTLTLNNGYSANTEILVTVTYQWGPSLGGSSHLNPFDFFNPKTPTAAPQENEKYNGEATYKALAQSALGQLNTLVNTQALSFKVAVAKA